MWVHMYLPDYKNKFVMLEKLEEYINVLIQRMTQVSY